MALISSYWETERLFVRDAVVDTDLEDLQKLWESTAYIGEYDGHPERTEDDMYSELTEGDLPPGGTKERFRVQPFFSKATSEMVGYISLYHGYPDDETIWVTFFCLHASQQKKGFGHEVIQQFAAEATKAGFQRLMLPIALKNWRAIRFWSKAGFNKIAAVYGNEDYAVDAFLHIGLERSLI